MHNVGPGPIKDSMICKKLKLIGKIIKWVDLKLYFYRSYQSKTIAFFQIKPYLLLNIFSDFHPYLYIQILTFFAIGHNLCKFELSSKIESFLHTIL